LGLSNSSDQLGAILTLQIYPSAPQHSGQRSDRRFWHLGLHRNLLSNEGG